jgi:hypothetical protein
VLASNPRDFEANYGYGYALLQQGQYAKARPYLCKALPSPDVTIQREVSAMLRTHDLACD